MRPDQDVFQDLPIYFSKDGGTTWERLAWEDLPELGMESWPQPDVTIDGAQYTVTYKNLPSKVESISSVDETVTQTTNIQWSFSPDGVETESVPPAVDGYTAQVGENGTWYYLLNQEFTFTAQLRWGDLGNGQEVQAATGKTFSLYYIREDNQPVSLGTLKDLEVQGRLTYENQSTTPIITDVTISGYPEYDQNGNPIQYYVDLTAGHDETLDSSDGITALTGEDKITASFSNAGVPGYDAVSDRIYSGGTLTLTLTGTTSFSATKVWLDQADKNGRPEVSYSLWRRREGTSYHESQQLTNYIVTVTPKSDGGGNPPPDRYTLTVQEEDGKLTDLPKYDSDGYPYVYFLKESMSGGSNSYQQVFGTYQVDENGNVVYDENGDPVLEEGSDPLPKNYYGGGSRRDEDMGVYNNGTISNRLTETTTATLNKSWKASAFQGDLEDVTVTFRLQYRPEDDLNSEWFDTDEIRTQNGVIEESMASWTESAQVDKYGPLGKKLVYRWVEESITQNREPVELGPEEYIEDGQGRSILTRTFTLKHGKTGVTYRSETVHNQETGETTITNTVEDTLDYYVTKEWRGGRTPEEITINLYRMVSGASFDESDKPYLTFSWDGNSIAMSSPLPPDFVFSSEMSDSLKISKDEDGTVIWSALLSDLPRFNENGQEYEYLLLEDTTGQEGFPIYETERDGDGSYRTTVINGKGDGSMILVRKEWTDDTDIEHRGDVTIEVRPENNPEVLITKATIPEGVTTIEVGIDKYKPNEVFILETAVTVDGKEWKLPQYSTDADGMALLSGTTLTPTTAPGFHQYYATQYHRYEATYRDFEIDGSNQHVYVVNNRRLGNIDLTVTKNWVDGEGQLREALRTANEALNEERLTLTPYLKLVFAQDSEGKGIIEDSTVTIGDSASTEIKDKEGKPVQSMQAVNFSENSEETQEYYFYNLPKYDKDGAVLHYEVQEVWVVTGEDGDDSEELTPEELYGWLQKNLSESDTWEQIKDVLSAYSTTITEGEYESNDEAGLGEDGQPLHDKQPITVTNQLGNTKMISWTKHWNDVFTNEQNQRPDLYLDIYRMYHDEDGKIVVKLLREDYIWTPDVNDTDYTWTVTLSNVQKYDSLGYEIFYYAVERTKINFESYDYDVAHYSYPNPENEGAMIDLGSRDALSEDGEENVGGYGYLILDMQEDGDGYQAIPEDNKADYPHYALLEGGTITNSLTNEVTIQGRKVWVGTGGFPEEDLPAVTFAVDRYTGVEPPEENEWAEENKDVATITVSDWAAVNVNGTYTFTISHTGENTMVVNGDGSITYTYEEYSTPLPRYDENGSLYTYVLREESVDWAGGVDEDGKKVLESAQGEGTYVVENTYESPKGSIYVQKHLELPADLDYQSEDNKGFPSIQFKLTRTYTVENNGDKISKEDTAFNNANHTVTWSWEEVKNAYTNVRDAAETTAKTVWITSSADDGLVFDELPIYAPNGSKYVYKVEEVVDGFLYGYTTSSGIGKLERDNVTTSQSVVGNLFPVQLVPTPLEGDGTETEPYSSWATFKNALAQKTVTLEGKKCGRTSTIYSSCVPITITIPPRRSHLPCPASLSPSLDRATALKKRWKRGLMRYSGLERKIIFGPIQSLVPMEQG